MNVQSGGGPPIWQPSEGGHFDPTPAGWAAFRRAQAEMLQAGGANAGLRKDTALPPTVRWHRFPIVALRDALAVRLGHLDTAAARAEAAGEAVRAAVIRGHRADLVLALRGADRPVMDFGGAVVSDPAILVGTPAPVCTRVPVWLILGHLASGMTAAEITAPDALPHLVDEDVEAALRAASAILDEMRAPTPPRVQTRAAGAADNAEPQEGAKMP